MIGHRGAVRPLPDQPSRIRFSRSARGLRLSSAARATATFRFQTRISDAPPHVVTKLDQVERTTPRLIFENERH
jgi:hypothetical protein